MEFTLEEPSVKKSTDLLIVPCFVDDGVCVLGCEDDAISMIAHPVIDLGDFSGKLKETTIIYTKDSAYKRIMLLGLGEKHELTKESLKKAVASATKEAIAKKLKNISACTFSHPRIKEEELLTCMTEAFCLTDYSFDKYKGKKDKEAKKLLSVIFVTSCKEAEVVDQARILSESVNFTRDLVNGNADEVTPDLLLAKAKEFEKLSNKVKVTSFDRAEIEKRKMGLFGAVARSSTAEPRFIIVSYKGNKDSEDLNVIVGKGITYDTGGLSLKPTAGMITMKCDMGGGAAVLGTLRAIALLDLPVNVTAIVAATENSIGAKSYKPGDVYTGYSGTTVEITNTDAEGRLALADSLAYAVKELKPSRIIDMATLTGAQEVALGTVKSALFSNTTALAEALFKSGEESGDRVWEMPLDEDYRSLIDSSIADIKNSGSRSGSLSFSAMFLKEFVEDTPWAHIDIAGPAFLDSPRDYHRSSATGAGVRLLVEFFKTHAGKLSQ